jgi:putative membrane protein
MKGLILGIVAGAIAFVVLLFLLPDSLVAFEGDNVQLAILALVVGVVNAVIKPIIKALSFPISMMTLGLFGFVINAGLLLATAWLTTEMANLDFSVGGFPPDFSLDTIIGAFVASIVLSIITTIVGLVVHD